MYDFLVRVQELDRRWIFLGMALAILIPMFVPFNLPVPIREEVRNLHTRVEEVPAGGLVLISADYDPTSRPELDPYFRATLHQLFRNDVRVVVSTLWATASGLVEPTVREIAAEYGKERGEDWAFLGFIEGKELAIKAMGSNMRQAFPVDFYGTRLDDIPIMEGIQQVQDFEMVLSVSAGFPGTREWVLQVQGQYDLLMASATTAVSTPDYMPYYNSGQIFGLVGGMPGAAQYEQLVGIEGGLGTKGVNILSLGHLFIIFAIFFGNLAYFLTRDPEAS